MVNIKFSFPFETNLGPKFNFWLISVFIDLTNIGPCVLKLDNQQAIELESMTAEELFAEIGELSELMEQSQGKFDRKKSI